jgi:putative peptide zinc metalloprotease protein
MDLTTTKTQLTAPPPATGQRWRQARGLQFLGPVQGSGLKDPTFLVRRVDDQVVQLSELLHLVVRAVEPSRPAEQVADDVSAAYGRTLSVRGLEHLVTTRLAPLGLVVPDEAPEPLRPVRARPLLALTAKGTLVPSGRRSASSSPPRRSSC